MFRITRAWIHEHKTERGGWTMAQTKALGLAWPLERGWLDEIAGREISDEAKAAFESANATFRPKTVRLLKKHGQPVFCPHCGANIHEAPDLNTVRPCWSKE